MAKKTKSEHRLTPQEVFYEYLSEVLIASKSITEKETKEIFLKALRDYFEKKIDLKTVSEVATELYYEFNKPFEIESKFDRDLAKALFDATEVDWYHDHQKDSPGTKGTYEIYFKSIKEYYEKTKLLKNP